MLFHEAFRDIEEKAAAKRLRGERSAPPQVALALFVTLCVSYVQCVGWEKEKKAIFTTHQDHHHQTWLKLFGSANSRAPGGKTSLSVCATSDTVFIGNTAPMRASTNVMIGFHCPFT